MSFESVRKFKFEFKIKNDCSYHLWIEDNMSVSVSYHENYELYFPKFVMFMIVWNWHSTVLEDEDFLKRSGDLPDKLIKCIDPK